MPPSDTPPHAQKLLALLGEQSETESGYRARLREHLDEADDAGVLCAATVRLKRALTDFSQQHCPLADSRFLCNVRVLPTYTNVFANVPVSGQEVIAISHGFLDLLSFHHRASAAFRMCEMLADRGIAEVAGTRSTRALLYMAHLDLIGQWLVRPFLLDDLPAAAASPTLLAEEFKVFQQGLLFFLLHEQGHSALGHRSAASPPSNTLPFDLVTPEQLDRAKSHELAADNWAAQAMWSSTISAWQVAAVVRMFLLVGLGHAASGRISATHPYVSNRLAHLVASLQDHPAEAGAFANQPAEWLASEYDDWRRLRHNRPSTDEVTRAIGLLSVEAAKRWLSCGGDKAVF